MGLWGRKTLEVKCYVHYVASRGNTTTTRHCADMSRGQQAGVLLVCSAPFHTAPLQGSRYAGPTLGEGRGRSLPEGRVSAEIIAIFLHQFVCSPSFIYLFVSIYLTVWVRIHYDFILLLQWFQPWPQELFG